MGATTESAPIETNPAVTSTCLVSKESLSMLRIPRVRARTPVAETFPPTRRSSAVATAAVMRGAPPRSGNRQPAWMREASTLKGEGTRRPVA
jgi:hypothetical protein